MFETNATQKALGYKNRFLKLESKEGKLTNFLKHQKVLRYVWKRSQQPVSFVFDHSLHFSTAYKNNKRRSFPSVWRVADSRHELKSNKSLKRTQVCLDLILDNIHLHFYCCKISSCKKEINSPTLAAERSRPVIHALIAMTEVCMWPVLTLRGKETVITTFETNKRETLWCLLWKVSPEACRKWFQISRITGTLNGLPLRTVSTNHPVEFTLTVRHSHTSTPRGEGVTVADRTKHLWAHGAPDRDSDTKGKSIKWGCRAGVRVQWGTILWAAESKDNKLHKPSSSC